jgi:hypothetical protein
VKYQIIYFPVSVAPHPPPQFCEFADLVIMHDMNLANLVINKIRKSELKNKIKYFLVTY